MYIVHFICSKHWLWPALIKHYVILSMSKKQMKPVQKTIDEKDDWESTIVPYTLLLIIDLSELP